MAVLLMCLILFFWISTVDLVGSVGVVLLCCGRHLCSLLLLVGRNWHIRLSFLDESSVHCLNEWMNGGVLNISWWLLCHLKWNRVHFVIFLCGMKGCDWRWNNILYWSFHEFVTVFYLFRVEYICMDALFSYQCYQHCHHCQHYLLYEY